MKQIKTNPNQPVKQTGDLRRFAGVWFKPDLPVAGLLTSPFCFEEDSIRQDKPSRTAYKVALNIVTLGAKPGLDRVFPPGTVQATEKLLVAIGADGRPDAGRWTGLMLWLQKAVGEPWTWSKSVGLTPMPFMSRADPVFPQGG